MEICKSDEGDFIHRCDRCSRVMEQHAGDCEWQERLVVSFIGGWGSVFGDGNLVQGDFCQDCFKEVLGPWLRITMDASLDNPHGSLHKIIQPYQA